MIEEEAVRLEQTMDGGKIDGQIFEAHMFEHADASDLVVDRIALQVAVILQLDADSVGESRLGDALLRHLQLLRTQGHAVGTDPVALCCVNHERAPTAADIEKVLSRPQRQLAANVI